MATDAETVIDTGAPGEPIVTGEPNHEKPEQIDPEAFYGEEGGQGQPATEGEQQQGDDGTHAEGDPQPEQEAIAVPTSWSNEYKDAFSKLPRDLQQIVSTREAERERFVTQKSQEAARTRETVETEARQHIGNMLNNHAQAIELMAQSVGLPQPPDPNLLNSQDPEHHRLYMVQQNRYQATAAQLQEMQRTAEATRQQAQALQSQAEQAAIQEDEAKIVAKWPGWSEPSERAKLLARLQPIAAELGYGAEAQAQANSADLFALDKVATWKADADKYRDLMKQKMVPVRAAKQVPPAMRAGSPSNGASQPVDTAALLYPDDQPRR